MAMNSRHQPSTDPTGGSALSPRIRAPQSLADSGLTRGFLAELITKILLLRGRLSLSALAGIVKLPASIVAEVLAFVRAERLAEVNRSGATDADAEFQLTEAGRARAGEALERCQYAGPAPVPLAAYAQTVAQQSQRELRFGSEEVRRALSGLILDGSLVDQLGAAMNSGRPVLLYGPAGSGKTYLAEQFSGLLPGSILVPHAITVGAEIIQVFDPLVHKAEEDSALANGGIVRTDRDLRWVTCRRPVVMTGGELTLAMLDLQFDASTRFYQAPPHVRANGGLLIIDDLGRQLVEPRQLMNRWIVPLDRRRDYLGLHNGFKFEIPFDLWVVFSTNLRPQNLADDAFLRRFGYKVHVGPMTLGDYRRVFMRVCDELGVGFDSSAFEWLITDRHRARARPLLACYPRDLVERVRDFAIYEGSAPEASPAALARAWDTYFVSDDADDHDGPVSRGVDGQSGPSPRAGDGGFGGIAE